MAEKEFKAVKIERGSQGWGGPLVIEPTAEKDKIVAVTGGGIPGGGPEDSGFDRGRSDRRLQASATGERDRRRGRGLWGDGTGWRVSAQAHPNHQPDARRTGRSVGPIHHGRYLRFRCSRRKHRAGRRFRRGRRGFGVFGHDGSRWRWRRNSSPARPILTVGRGGARDRRRHHRSHSRHRARHGRRGRGFCFRVDARP